MKFKFHIVTTILFLSLSLSAQTKKPNIIILFADDLGYGELRCQGNNEIPTPHIDSIAKNGVRFTNGYITTPFCAPSRAGLYTGRHQSRFGWNINVMPHTNPGSSYGIPSSETTIAERLKEAGYRTGLIGKWHLGSRKDFSPVHNGFDYFYGFAHEGRYFVRPPYQGVTSLSNDLSEKNDLKEESPERFNDLFAKWKALDPKHAKFNKKSECGTCQTCPDLASSHP